MLEKNAHRNLDLLDIFRSMALEQKVTEVSEIMKKAKGGPLSMSLVTLSETISISISISISHPETISQKPQGVLSIYVTKREGQNLSRAVPG